MMQSTFTRINYCSGTLGWASVLRYEEDLLRFSYLDREYETLPTPTTTRMPISVAAKQTALFTMLQSFLSIPKGRHFISFTYYGAPMPPLNDWGGGQRYTPHSMYTHTYTNIMSEYGIVSAWCTVSVKTDLMISLYHRPPIEYTP